MFRTWAIAAAATVASLSSATARGQILIETCTPLSFTYCYESGIDTSITFYCADPLSPPLMLLVCAGQVEACCDSVFIFDGPDVLSPMLYAGNGFNGDLTGSLAMVTNPENALTIRFFSNDSVDCGSEGYVPLNWAVGPSTFSDCTMGLHEPAQNEMPSVQASLTGVLFSWSIAAGQHLEARLFDTAGRCWWTGAARADMIGQALITRPSLSAGAWVLELALGDRVARVPFVLVP